MRLIVENLLVAFETALLCDLLLALQTHRVNPVLISDSRSSFVVQPILVLSNSRHWQYHSSLIFPLQKKNAVNPGSQDSNSKLTQFLYVFIL